MKRIDRVGMRVGKLVLTRYVGRDGHTEWWECRCDCGGTRTVRWSSLYKGQPVSCGCVHGLEKHGDAKTGRMASEYSTWRGMWTRCTYPKDRWYRNYGGRGITVCARWKDYAAFLADMGRRPQGYTLDRINNDGNYEPGNCRWATRKEQKANQRKVAV